MDIDRTTRLLDTVGVFGVRELVRATARGELDTAEQMAGRLVSTSGLEGLRDRLRGQFGARASILKAQTALHRLRTAAGPLETVDPDAAAWLVRGIERIESSAIELALLRAIHLVTSGTAPATSDEVNELGRLAGDGEPPERLGLDRTAPTDRLMSRALERIGAWRAVGTEPLADPARIELAATMARAYEQIVSSLHQRNDAETRPRPFASDDEDDDPVAAHD